MRLTACRPVLVTIYQSLQSNLFGFLTLKLKFVNSLRFHKFAFDFIWKNMKKFKFIIIGAGLVSIVLTGCKWTTKKAGISASESLKCSVMKEKFGTVDDKPVWLFTLKNGHHTTVKITNYGGII